MAGQDVGWAVFSSGTPGPLPSSHGYWQIQFLSFKIETLSSEKLRTVPCHGALVIHCLLMVAACVFKASKRYTLTPWLRWNHRWWNPTHRSDSPSTLFCCWPETSHRSHLCSRGNGSEHESVDNGGWFLGLFKIPHNSYDHQKCVPTLPSVPWRNGDPMP